MLLGNPLQEKHVADGDWISLVSTKNKTIRKLDGKQRASLRNFTECGVVVVKDIRLAIERLWVQLSAVPRGPGIMRPAG